LERGLQLHGRCQGAEDDDRRPSEEGGEDEQEERRRPLPAEGERVTGHLLLPDRQRTAADLRQVVQPPLHQGQARGAGAGQRRSGQPGREADRLPLPGQADSSEVPSVAPPPVEPSGAPSAVAPERRMIQLPTRSSSTTPITAPITAGSVKRIPSRRVPK